MLLRAPNTVLALCEYSSVVVQFEKRFVSGHRFSDANND